MFDLFRNEFCKLRLQPGQKVFLFSEVDTPGHETFGSMITARIIRISRDSVILNADVPGGFGQVIMTINFVETVTSVEIVFTDECDGEPDSSKASENASPTHNVFRNVKCTRTSLTMWSKNQYMILSANRARQMKRFGSWTAQISGSSPIDVPTFNPGSLQ